MGFPASDRMKKCFFLYLHVGDNVKSSAAGEVSLEVDLLMGVSSLASRNNSSSSK